MSKRNRKLEEHPSRSGAAAARSFVGLRVFVVEDEAMVSMLIEDTLADIGCSVAGTAARLDEAMIKAAALDFDLAILDVNLNGIRAYPLAEVLAKRGVPLVFATGYGAAGIPNELRHIPLLAKPFQQRDLERALAKALPCKAAVGC
jgi:CheY-like chemotaxis protein